MTNKITVVDAIKSLRTVLDGPNSRYWAHGPAVQAVIGRIAELEAQSVRVPAIPDGYVVVPREPTEEMIIRGFESCPSLIFSEPEVWEEYDAMSGCQQAAHKAKLCWEAMIAAVPKVVK